MKTRIEISTVLLGCAIAAAGLGIARAEQAKPAASASASATPLEGEPQAVNGKKPWAPVFTASVPETPSDPPTREEWERAEGAPEVRITAPDCRASRVREYYRIQCRAAHWIALVSGGREGVTFGCKKGGPKDDVCDDTWVIFPARRGDRRAFEFFHWSKYGPSPDSVATEQFLEGDPYPLVSVHGIHWGY